MPSDSPLARYSSRAVHWGDSGGVAGTSSEEEGDAEDDEREGSFFFAAAPVAELTVESSRLGFSYIEVLPTAAPRS